LAKLLLVYKITEWKIHMNQGREPIPLRILSLWVEVTHLQCNCHPNYEMK